MADATCSTCPWWAERGDRSGVGLCHHASADDGPSGEPVRMPGWWCSEHPLRQRDQLAAMAMQGALAGEGGDGRWLPGALAAYAYEVADAMLAERAKKGGHAG